MQTLYLIFLVWIPILYAQGPIFDGIIRKSPDGRFFAYLIPPFESNHASFLERLPNGNLFLAWFSGTAEGQTNVSIVLAHLPFGSLRWSSAVLVSRRPGFSNQNPVLFYDNVTKIFHLYHSQQPADQGESKSNIWHLVSTNQGESWSQPVEAFTQPGSFDRNRIVVARPSGDILYPVYFSDINQNSAIEISSDQLRTWKEYPISGSNDLVQPSVIQLPGTNRFKAFFRDRRAEWIYFSLSSDGGHIWTVPQRTALPNNNAAIQALVLMSGAVVLAFNDETSGRNSISIALSYDEGDTWRYVRKLEPEVDGKLDVEYSYPSVLQTPDGDIHVTYTYDRETIKYNRITEDWIKSQS